MKTKPNKWLLLCCWTILGLMSCSIAAQSRLTTDDGSVIPNETLYVWAKNGLFLRATPSLQGEIIGKIPFGETVKAISAVRGEEHSVVFFPEQEVEIVDGCDRDQFSYYETAEKKEITKGVQLSGNWVKVAYGEEEAYVSYLYVSRYPPFRGTGNWFKQFFEIDDSRKVSFQEGDYWEDLFYGRQGVTLHSIRGVSYYSSRLCLPLGEWKIAIHLINDGLESFLPDPRIRMSTAGNKIKMGTFEVDGGLEIELIDGLLLITNAGGN